MADFFIVGTIILAVILSVLYLIKQARSGKGCCGGCAGCSKACARRKEEK
ncbi:FeoB-associated Cys-rich membrane protein [Intestinibacillus sp. Marseille-P6563]|nr:FeoB-associated Cys-rich membrane protein [Intestinibacillus sp. Marseille-P6563]